MRLPAGSRSIELRVRGYEFPDRLPDGRGWDWDANWLQIAGDVQDGELGWRFTDPCLTTREARALLDWLRLAANGPSGPAGNPVLDFTEPNLRFELRGMTADTTTIAILFSHESAPPNTDGHELVMELSPELIREAADAWADDLARSPER